MICTNKGQRAGWTKGKSRNGSGSKAGHETSNKEPPLENKCVKARIWFSDGKGMDGCIFLFH